MRPCVTNGRRMFGRVNWVERRRFREKIVLLEMMTIYCEAHHNEQGQFLMAEDLAFDDDLMSWVRRRTRWSWRRRKICPQCMKLLQKIIPHIVRCPHMATKTFCHKCEQPCFTKTEIQVIQPLMKYSGKKMFRKHMILSFLFAHDLLRVKKNQTS